MRRLVFAFVSLTALALPSYAADPEPEGDGGTIGVVADPYARWDHTRWYIKTEIVMPYPITFFADINAEFRAIAFQVRTVLACDEDRLVAKRRMQVDCRVEDVGLRFTPLESMMSSGKAWGKVNHEAVAKVVTELHDKLSKATMRLQADDLGRVDDIAIHGVDTSDEKSASTAESLRMIMSRVLVGFDMRLRRYERLQAGAWAEYDSRLMTFPFTTEAMGGSEVLDKLETRQGHRIVQTVGKGMLSDGQGNYWDTRLVGVSVYDGKDGIMTERVWALNGMPTASSAVAEGESGLPYLHAGRIRQIQPSEHPNCGPSTEVAREGVVDPEVPAWLNLEEDDP